MMKRRTFLKASAAGAAAAACGSYTSAPAQNKRTKPNILLLFSDQHNAGVMGCAGHRLVKTPHLDRLASEGVLFSRAYCPDGICVPSRTSMFTGLYPRTTGVIYNSDAPPHPERLHPLHSLLRANGYLTGCFGKRHFPRGLNETDWDASCTTINPKLDPSDENYWDWIKARGQYDSHNRDFKESHQASLMAHISRTAAWNRTTAYAADKSIDFIRHVRQEGKPFFCWSSFIYPHQPYTPLQEWARLYDPDKIDLPGNVSEPVENLPQRMREWRTRTKPPWNCGTAAKDPDIYRRYIAYYYALVSEVDHHIGRVLSALKDLGLADNTIVIYSSDHGDFVAGHGMVEKCAVGHNVYEDTLRVPLIFHWPDSFEKGMTYEGLVELTDLYPTLLDLTGIHRPSGGYDLSGRSLAPVLAGGSIRRKAHVFSENWSQVTIIGEQYKLGKWIRPPAKYATWDWGKTHPGMLFDRRNDPLEVNNLINDPYKNRVRQELGRLLAEWERQTPDDGKREVTLSFKKK
ncbi:MAG: sulfatase family protein [Planctomycetota bacterium]|jgi:arylsulfatase A-like enzyme